MTTSIFPETWGDLILDFRYVKGDDGAVRPALVAVNANGSPRTLDKVVEVRDGGGHVELHRNSVINADIGFDRIDSKVMIHPEGV